jgi:hypothetical protein
MFRSVAQLSNIESGAFPKSFDARLCDELLDREIFYSLREPQIVIESWRHFDALRPNVWLGYRLRPQFLRLFITDAGGAGPDDQALGMHRRTLNRGGKVYH